MADYEYINLNEDIVEEDEIKDIVLEKENNIKITLPIMTMYEKVNIITQRVKQLDSNYKTTVPEEIKEKGITKSIDIALLEFDLKKLPNFSVIRKFPNGTYETWKLEDFEEFP